MQLTDYTTYADVRGVLGVSDDELEDSTLALGVWSDQLALELDEIGANLRTDFDTVVAIDEASRSAAQQKFYRTTRLFAAYEVANQLGSGLPMFGPKDITDGKASFSRFSDSPYKQTLKEVKAKYEEFLQKLTTAHAALSSATVSTTTRVLFAGVGQAVDPVTGS